jgi:hypothetical protein
MGISIKIAIYRLKQVGFRPRQLRNIARRVEINYCFQQSVFLIEIIPNKWLKLPRQLTLPPLRQSLLKRSAGTITSYPSQLLENSLLDGSLEHRNPLAIQIGNFVDWRT